MSQSVRSILLLILIFISSPVFAHKLAPSLLSLVEQTPQQFSVTWKTPKITAANADMKPILPAHCAWLGQPQTRPEGSGFLSQWNIKCDQAMVGSEIAVEGMASSGTATLVKIEFLDERLIQQLLTANDPKVIVPEKQSLGQVMQQYISLGVEHILLGLDHLLFVLALLMLIRHGRKLFWTITAFTLGHSVTLSLVSLGYMDYPVGLVEFAIALSIFVMAVELSRKDNESHWISRHSWVVAVCFGLLHGMGFAGALREVGLPPGDIPLALFSFNVGIEIGQILFVLAVFFLIKLLRERVGSWGEKINWLAVYSIGGLSAFWCIERSIGA